MHHTVNIAVHVHDMYIEMHSLLARLSISDPCYFRSQNDSMLRKMPSEADGIGVTCSGQHHIMPCTEARKYVLSHWSLNEIFLQLLGSKIRMV